MEMALDNIAANATTVNTQLSSLIGSVRTVTDEVVRLNTMNQQLLTPVLSVEHILMKQQPARCTHI